MTGSGSFEKKKSSQDDHLNIAFRIRPNRGITKKLGRVELCQKSFLRKFQQQPFWKCVWPIIFEPVFLQFTTGLGENSKYKSCIQAGKLEVGIWVVSRGWITKEIGPSNVQ